MLFLFAKIFSISLAVFAILVPINVFVLKRKMTPVETGIISGGMVVFLQQGASLWSYTQDVFVLVLAMGLSGACAELLYRKLTMKKS